MIERFVDDAFREKMRDPDDCAFMTVLIPGDIGPEERHHRFTVHLDAELRLAGLGCSEGGGTLKAADITTVEYPGFPTDMQAQFMALANQRPQFLSRANPPPHGVQCPAAVHERCRGRRKVLEKIGAKLGEEMK